MAKHWFGDSSKSSKGKGHPIMYGKPKPAIHFQDFPDGGGYPIGFPEWAFGIMGVTDPSKVLHLCSGSMLTGVRVDIRPEMNPTVCCDVRNTPFPDESFDFIMSDPPYGETYAEQLYGTGKAYPKPGQIMKEAARLLRPGGYFGILHFIVPITRKPMKMIQVYGITTGAGYAIRAWSLFTKTHLTKHAPDVGDSAASSDIFPASEVSALQGESAPAPTQVM
jgi:SAM-dependent methyltransferase